MTRIGPMRLTFVTGNAGKLAEVAAHLAPLGIEVVADRRGYAEVQADTLEEVARHGAAELLAGGLAPPFLLEDSGLFVAGLGGFPGVYSRHALDTIGNAGLLRLLAGMPDAARRAHFEACLAYVDPAGAAHVFHGRAEGRIAPASLGSNGFGFDPVFVPSDPAAGGRTFAQMEAAEKRALGHRGKAVRLLVDHLAKAAKT